MPAVAIARSAALMQQQHKQLSNSAVTVHSAAQCSSTYLIHSNTDKTYIVHDKCATIG